MHLPLVSVIIPTYNRGKTIQYCLNSVINQTYTNLEIIISDDCSTDKTVEIVNAYHDDRIRIIRAEKNSGAQAARNQGIKEAHADWIAFLDSDDEWTLNKIERQIKILEQYAWDMFIVIHSDAIVIDTKNGSKKLFGINKINGENVFSELLKSPAPLFPAILTSKRALESIGYLDENVPSYQEWDTSIRLSEICEFVCLDEPTFTYYLHTGETISKNYLRDIEGYDYILNKFETKIKSICGIETWVNHLTIQYKKCIDWGFIDRAKYYLNRLPLSARFQVEFNRFKFELKNYLRKYKHKILKRS